MKKTTNELSINELKLRYAVEYNGPDAFIAALENGEILAMITKCADAMHAGDNTDVLKQLVRNCQDKVCRRKSRPATNSRQKNEDLMVDAFNEWLHKQLAGKKAVATQATQRTGNKPAHMLTPEDLASIDDAETMRRRINSLVDYRSKHLLGVLTDEETAKKAQIEESLAFARARFKELKAAAVKAAEEPEQKPVEISEKLMAKLAKGGAASLSAAEVAEVAEILKSLNK